MQLNKALLDYDKKIETIRAADPTSALVQPDAIERGRKYIESLYAEHKKGSAVAVNAIDKQIAALQLQNDTFGMTERAAALYKMTLDGATVSQLSTADAALTQAENIKILAAQYPVLNDASAKAIVSAYNEANKNEELIRTYGMSKSAIEAETIARLEANRVKLIANDATAEDIKRTEQAIDAHTRNAAALSGLETQAALKKYADKMERTNEQIGRSLTDALLRGFESGKSFAQNFRDTLVNMFKTLILQPIIQPIMTSMAGAVTGVLGLGMPGTAGATGAAEVGSSAMSLASVGSNIKSMYSAFTGGFAQAGLAMADFGAQLGSNFIVDFGGGFAGAQSATGFAAGMGAAASFLAGAGAGYGVGSLISGNMAAFGDAKVSNIAGAAIGAAIGSVVPVIGTLVGGLIGGAIGGLVNRAFGKGPKEYGNTSVVGNFSAAGFNGRNETPWERSGGWFSSGDNGVDTRPLEAGFVASMTQAFGLLKVGAAGLATSIGVSTDALATYTHAMNVTLTDDAAKNQELIAATLDAVGEGLVTALIPSIGAYAKENETATQTLQRLSTSLSTVNGTLSMLRQRLLGVSLAGADSAAKLADLFGGLDGFGTAVQAYFQVAYSESERATLSLENMSNAFAAVNVVMPTSMTQLRSVAEALDKNTDSGRAAWAVLVSLAPEFASTAEAIARAAQETADKLLAAYTGNGLLMPALDTAMLKTLRLKDSLISTYTAAGNISTLFLELDSGLITFGSSASGLTDELTGAQQASLMLRDQVLDLSTAAQGGIVDFVGLAKALDKFDTQTFVATVSKAFEGLAERIKGVLGDINAERIAIRDAASQIMNPGALTPAQIRRELGGINTTLPGNAGLLAAGAQLNAADAVAAQRKAQENSARAAYQPAQAAFDTAAAQVGDLQAQLGNLRSIIGTNEYEIAQPRKYSEGRAYVRDLQAQMPALYDQLNQLESALSAATSASSSARWNEVVNLSNAYAQAVSQSAAAQAAATAAATTAKAASTAYGDALQGFALDAAKSVSKLSSLREETLKYYQAQKQLADLMGASAAGLRKTVDDFRKSQLSPEQQFNALQADYAKAYAMALSTDGDVLAGYGDQMNGMLNQLLESAKDYYGSDAQYNSFANTAIARAEAIAARLEAVAPHDYEQESLGLLGQIDITLAALEASAKTADQLIVGAINAGRDATVNGLRQVINALTGGTVAAFASGGAFTNGVVSRPMAFNNSVMGEAGPEAIMPLTNIGGRLGVRSLGGGNQELLAEMRALRQSNEALHREVANLRIEARATAVNTNRIAKQGDRNEVEGVLVRTDADTPLNVEVTA